MAQEPNIQVGDYVTYRIFNEAKGGFTDMAGEGAIVEISDNRGIPGELMYAVHVEGGGPLWLHRKEIHLHDEEKMLSETAHQFWAGIFGQYTPEQQADIKARIIKHIQEKMEKENKA